MANLINLYLSAKKIQTHGQSMEPFLFDGDVLFLVKKPVNRIKINDFITFKVKNLFITHRVIFKHTKDDYLITKGDNNHVADKKVYPKQIIGVVDSVKRRGQLISIESLYLIQSTLYFQEIAKVSKLFFNEKIDFLILKGLPLHLYFENEYPKRIYADCDFLIDKRHFDEVIRILRTLGFTSVSTPLSKIHGALKDKNPEVTFYKKVNGINVILDIHLEAVFLMTQLGNLNMLYPQKLIDELSLELLREKKFIRVRGFDFPVLALEYLVVYLGLHLFHHNFRGYFRYELMKNIIKGQKVNFNKMLEIIIKYKLEDFVYPVFYFLKKTYSSPIDKKFLRVLEKRMKSSQYFRKIISKISIFEDEGRLVSGVNRFKNIYELSPNPQLYKIWIFLNPQVIYSVVWVLQKRVIYSLNKIFLSSSKDNNSSISREAS